MAGATGRTDGAVALFWDIDGTLLSTARAGLLAFEAAVADLAGVSVDLDGLATSGCSDAEVATLVLEAAGVEPSPELIDPLLRAYERYLPSKLPLRCGHVKPGVTEVLAALAAREDVVSLLLTGNTPAGAAAKLAHYGLDRYFAGGAFCTGPRTREEIAQCAAELAAQRAGGPIGRSYVIGDSPSDIRCSRAIGARCVAVASGWHSRAELAEHRPWLLLDRIPSPEAFFRLVEIDR
jgi:phosphoglycolate phosphatase-like HAD superfamily hydrolase